mmetsp:Transcript_69183/g.207522  ORF Transcript_69183/g.207522 Transcript_69183/m.207522 type:complete len:210 (-) Transcript_69183:4020-4649(-)
MYCTHADRSDWLNSYGMLKPRGPNLRRSWTMVCMKQRAYSIDFHCGCDCASSMSCVTHAYEFLRPARTPAGASFVILIAICSRPIGNLGCDSEVTQSWNSGWISSSLIIVCSISSMNLRPRWQFCSITHEPCVTPVEMSLRAAGSCPWPSEIERTAFLSLRASSMMTAVGSEPCESTATMGQRQLASSSTSRRSSGRESMNFCPMVFAM